MKISICVTITCLLLSVAVAAALPKAGALPRPILNRSGVLMGGQAGENLALLDLRRSDSKTKKMERIVLEFGSADLKERKGLVGYYHAELQDQPARLVLDLPQTYASRLPEKEILNRLKNSLFIREAMIQFDRSSQSMSFVFHLKQPVQLRVSRVDNPEYLGKLVLDMAPEAPRRLAQNISNGNRLTAKEIQQRKAGSMAKPVVHSELPATQKPTKRQ